MARLVDAHWRQLRPYPQAAASRHVTSLGIRSPYAADVLAVLGFAHRGRMSSGFPGHPGKVYEQVLFDGDVNEELRRVDAFMNRGARRA